MTTQYAFLNGSMFAFDDVGSGPAILLIHGFPLSRAMWHPQLADLVAGGYRVIAPDLRGFGQSDEQDFCSMDLFADDLVALLDHLEIPSAVVVGMSMGGYILFNLLERYPGLISGAVFLVTRSAADDETGKARRLQLAQELRTHGPQIVTDSFHTLLFAPETLEKSPKLGEEVYSWMAGTGSRGLAAGLLAMRDRKDATPQLSQITIPALSVGADHDLACPLEHPRMIATGIPGCRLEIIPDAGHMVNIEQPNLMNQLLLEFLRTVAPTPLNDGSIGCNC